MPGSQVASSYGRGIRQSTHDGSVMRLSNPEHLLYEGRNRGGGEITPGLSANRKLAPNVICTSCNFILPFLHSLQFYGSNRGCRRRHAPAV